MLLQPCFAVPLSLIGIEEYFMVHGEVVNGDLPRQFANPRGYSHHPVQHDADQGM